MLKEFYLRDGYDELYEDIRASWKVAGADSVVLLGNAGTGKSWFQIYVLRLMLTQYHADTADYDLVFRQPGPDKELAPTVVELPSLATLSPYEKRIAEYTKFATVRFNYYLYGGIIRHHLKPSIRQKETKQSLADRLANLDLRVLASKAANVDRDATGNNVSGYILCYDGKHDALERKSQGGNRCFFDRRVLRYTSEFVEERVEEILDRTPLISKMMVVLDRLNDRGIDLSGKNLEAVATEFLSKVNVKWQVKRVGVGEWSDFTTKKRTVVKDYNITQWLTKANQLLVPTNTSFPVADMVFSNWGNDPALVFQCTWQLSHPFTVREVYDLRVKHLGVPASKLVYIILVAPGQEEKFAARKEEDYLSSSLDEPLQYANSETVSVPELNEMWSHTEVHILRPKLAWKQLIVSWLDSQSMKQATTEMKVL